MACSDPPSCILLTVEARLSLDAHANQGTRAQFAWRSGSPRSNPHICTSNVDSFLPWRFTAFPCTNLHMCAHTSVQAHFETATVGLCVLLLECVASCSREPE